MASSSRSKTRNARRTGSKPTSSYDATVSSEEAIKSGEQIALAAFASGIKLAAAFGSVAAKTAGLALASMASGADKFSELVREEAMRSNNRSNHSDSHRSQTRPKNNGRRRKSG